VRAEVAALAGVGGVAVGAVAVELGEQHGHVLGAAEGGIAALAVQDDGAVPAHLAEEERVGDGEGIAVGLVHPRDGVVEVGEDRVGPQLDDAVLGAGVRGDERAEGQLVAVLGAERDRERADGVVV
jgi:hypothetical protein